jgi:hypothetical protein
MGGTDPVATVTLGTGNSSFTTFTTCFKNAAGVALLSLPVFLSPGSSGASTPRFLVHPLIVSPRAQVV